MKLTVNVTDEVVTKLWERHRKRVAAITDEWERARMEIWSTEEVIAAEAATLLQFYADGKLDEKS